MADNRQETTMSAASTAASTLARAFAALLAAIVLTVACAASAQAADPLEVVPGSFTATTSTTQAGAHPDVRVAFRLNSTPNVNAAGALLDEPPETTRTVVVDLPPGIVGNPTALPQCDLEIPLFCPPETAVGVVRLRTFLLKEAEVPVYNLVPSHGAPAEFGFWAALTVKLQVSVRSDSDYGLRTTIDNLPTPAPLVFTDLTLWGVPADSSHDDVRGSTCTDEGLGAGMICMLPPRPSSAPRTAFLTNGSACDAAAAPVRMAIESYDRPGRLVRAETPFPTPTGCDRTAVRRQRQHVPTTPAPASRPATRSTSPSRRTRTPTASRRRR